MEANFEEDRTPINWKGIRKYYLEREAVLFAARLRSMGIPVSLNNYHVAHPLPLSGANYELKVPERLREQAEALLAELEQEVGNFKPMEESFRDISKEEIKYLKQVNQNGLTLNRVVMIFLILLLVSLLIRAVINGATSILF